MPSPGPTSSLPPTATPVPSSSTPTVESSQSTTSSGQTTSQSLSVFDAITSKPSVKSSETASSVQFTNATSSSAPLPVTPSPSNSTTDILSSSTSFSSSVVKVSPASSIQGTASVAVQPTKQTTTTTSGAGDKGKSIGGLEIVGIVLVAILGLLVAAFGIYFFFFRKKMYPEYWSELVESPAPSEPAAAAQTAFPEVGITHQAFVGDAESPTNVTAPETEVKAPEPEVKAVEPEVKAADLEVKAAEPEVKVAEPEANVSEPEVKSEVKENEAAEENFSEDSAL
ncbi:hypothetical protein ACROYT_G026614 [Oculina patagonica]